MKINSLIALFLFAISISSCNYVQFKRHLEGNIASTLNFNETGTVTKSFKVSTAQFLKKLDQNIDSKDVADIENIQISDLAMTADLTAGNTATLLKNVRIALVSTVSDTIYKLNEDTQLLNRTNLLLFKGLIDPRAGALGLVAVKFKIEEAIRKRSNEAGTLSLSFTLPAGQKLTGVISLSFKVSLDAVTCEQVPFGLGPSECF